MGGEPRNLSDLTGIRKSRGRLGTLGSHCWDRAVSVSNMHCGAEHELGEASAPGCAKMGVFGRGRQEHCWSSIRRSPSSSQEGSGSSIRAPRPLCANVARHHRCETLRTGSGSTARREHWGAGTSRAMLLALVALLCTASGVNGGVGIANPHRFNVAQRVLRVPFRSTPLVMGLRLKGGGEEASSAELESSVVSSEDDDDENEEARAAEARAAATHREEIAAVGAPPFPALCLSRPQVAFGGTPDRDRN